MPYECQECGILLDSGILCAKCAAIRKRQLPSGSSTAQPYRHYFRHPPTQDQSKPPPNPPTIPHEPIRHDTHTKGERTTAHDSGRGDMDRAEASRALSKVFAYMAVGKRDVARAWAKKLVSWLEWI